MTVRRKGRRISATAAIVGVALLVSGCTSLLFGPVESTAELSPGDGFVAMGDTRSLTQAADAIVVGRVVATRTVAEPAAGGGEVFYTDVDVEVSQVLKGTAPARTTVRTVGGTVGDLTMLAFGEPVFRVGEEAFLFLSSEIAAQGQSYAVCGANRGKLTLQGNRVLEMDLTRQELVTRVLGSLAGEDPGPDPHFAPLAHATDVVWEEIGLAPLAYRFEDRRWPADAPVVPYHINAPQEWVAPINAAAVTWTAAGSKLVFQHAGSTGRQAGVLDGVNVVEARRTYGNTWVALATVWFTSGSRTGGPYYNIVEADIQVNLSYRWVIGSDPRGLDAQSVLTHELGHWLSLGDLYRPQWSELTMYGYVGYGETKKRTLEEPDRTGLLHIYGRR